MGNDMHCALRHVLIFSETACKLLCLSYSGLSFLISLSFPHPVLDPECHI